MKKEDIAIDLIRETEKGRVGGTERGGQIGGRGRVRVDARDTVAQEDTTVGQTLEVDLGPNHLIYENIRTQPLLNFSQDKSTSQPNLVYRHVLPQIAPGSYILALLSCIAYNHIQLLSSIYIYIQYSFCLSSV